MVQTSAFLEQRQLAKQLVQTLGQALSEQELANCLEQIEILSPTAGKRFWQAADATVGIYIILAGEVRLLDRSDNLIVSLEAGESFGELTLFPEDHQPYAARASVKLKLCSVPGDCLRSLIRHYPNIETHLRRQALQQDLLLLCRQNPLLSDAPIEGLMKTIPLLEQHQLQVGIPDLLRDSKLWLLRQGELLHSSGQRLTAGIYPSQLLKDRNWQVAQPTELFTLNQADWETARQHLPQLEKLMDYVPPLAINSPPEVFRSKASEFPIVLYEVTRDRVVVADPVIGQRTLTHAAFQAGWTGYALLLQPTALLKDANEASQPFWQFFELVKPHWLVLLEVFIASILIQVFGLITPLFTQLLLDRVVVQRSNLTLTAIGIGMLIFGLFRVAMTGLRQYLLDHTANKVDLALIVGFISHTFRLPLHFFESRYVGDIISRIQENRKIQRFLTGEALSILLDLLTVFICVGLMFWYSWKMALLTLVIVPPFVLLALIATPFLQKVSREIFGAYNEETGYLIQSLTGIRTVKSMAVERSVRWHWEELFGKSLKTNFSEQVIGNTLQIFSSAIEAVMTTVLLWFGAWQVIQGELTIGQLVAFNMLLGNVAASRHRLYPRSI